MRVFKPFSRFSELLLSGRFVLRSCAYMYGLSVFNYTCIDRRRFGGFQVPPKPYLLAWFSLT